MGSLGRLLGRETGRRYLAKKLKAALPNEDEAFLSKTQASGRLRLAGEGVVVPRQVESASSRCEVGQHHIAITGSAWLEPSRLN